MKKQKKKVIVKSAKPVKKRRNLKPSKQLTFQQKIQGLIKATSDNLGRKTKKQLKGLVLNLETINQKRNIVDDGKHIETMGRLNKELDAINKNIKTNKRLIDKYLK